MDINGITPGGGGLTATGAAIVRGQARFDDSAQRVVAEAERLSASTPPADEQAPGSPTPAADQGGGLAGALVGMQADAVSNRMLFAAYERQQAQQRDLLDMFKRSSA